MAAKGTRKPKKGPMNHKDRRGVQSLEDEKQLPAWMKSEHLVL